jgi:tetratricopeptide (TPR) repeat protein
MDRRSGEAPQQAGRYLLGRVLGSGAMGVVRASLDPVLEREVAVKVLGALDAASLRDTDDPTRSRWLGTERSPTPTSAAIDDARLLEEARALAKVAHPNIVEVFDVGVCEAGVFLAMELVDGVSLRVWNEEHEPDWRSAIAMYGQAGDALAAAHAVGIVHGDFKPDNVLVGADERVKVVDFGLARAIGRVEATDRGMVFGTPAYLAPECWDDASREPAADQFAFFVALCEAIAGRRPYPRTRSLEALFVALQKGPQLALLRRQAPPRVVQAIARGLDPDPARRFASMDEALAELRSIASQDRRTQSRLVWVAVGLGVLLPFVAIGAALAWHDRAEQRAAIGACTEQARAIAASWNDDTRTRVRAAMAAAEPRVGVETSTRVIGWLDAYATEWSELSARTCAAAVSEPTDLADVRGRCFAERASALSRLVAQLERADAEIVRSAVSSATELPRVEVCNDAAWLARHRATDPTPNEALERGRALVTAGRYDEAVPELEAAYFAAHELDDDASAAIAVELANVLGYRLLRFDEALVWARHAETALAAIGGPEGETRARLELAFAAVHVRRGEFDRSIERAERARDIRLEVFGADHPSVAAAELALGNALVQRERTADALASFERARGILERALGPEHIDLAGAYHSLGLTTTQLGRYADARALEERALAIRRLWLDPQHPDIATSLAGIAYADLGLDRYDEAVKGLEQVLAIREATYGAEHPAIAATLAAMAQVARRRGDCREAVRLLERANAISERVDAGDRRARLRLVLGLADALSLCDDVEAARRQYEAARALAEADAEQFAAELQRARAGLLRLTAG